MALVKCPECGGNISSSVDICVHCGFKLTLESKYENGFITEDELIKALDKLPNQEAMPIYEKLASKNNLYACRQIGNCYRDGANGYPKDFLKAKEYYSKCSDIDEECAFWLAWIFAKEHTGQNDIIIENYQELLQSRELSPYYKNTVLNNMGFYSSGEQKIDYYKEAYKFGSSLAVENVLTIYCNGKEYDEAITFTKEILKDTNNVNVDRKIVIDILGKKIGDILEGLLSQKNYNVAITFGEEVIKNMDISNKHKSIILNCLGMCISRKDFNSITYRKESCVYFKSAYETDDANYMAVIHFMAGCVFLARRGDKHCYQEAIDLGKNALNNKAIPKCSQGDIEWYLGICHEEKMPTDWDEAHKYYVWAKENGNEAASDSLKKLEEKMYTGICCPYCGSGNIKKIGFANKAVSVGLFGVFSLGHISKTYKCCNCGCKW